MATRIDKLPEAEVLATYGREDVKAAREAYQKAEEAFAASQARLRRLTYPVESQLQQWVQKKWTAAARGTGFPNVQVGRSATLTVTVSAISPLGSINWTWQARDGGESLEAWVMRVGMAWSALSHPPASTEDSPDGIVALAKESAPAGGEDDIPF